jgi:thiol-disulfide isomerase/thioredoxin
MKLALCFLTLTFSLLSCAREVPLPKPDQYEVKIFSAPWCYPCKEQVPQVDAAAKAKGVPLTVYIVSGYQPGTLPTQADADRYRQDLHLHALVETDPKFLLYNRYVRQGNYSVPMAAAVDSNGQVVRVFGPGRLDTDLVNYINH